ncbi:MAG TPA: hypothetical protein VIU62_06605 [Chloroflexota bacterium]|jgi:hypothetical protein
MSGMMVSRRTMLAAVLSAVPLGALAAPVFAGAEWCDDDPPITLTTPEGKKVHAFVTLSGRSAAFTSREEQQKYLLKDLQAAQITSTSRNAGDDGQATGDHQNQQQDCQAVNFTVIVTIPNDAKYGVFETRAIVSSEPNGTGTLYAKTHGKSSKPMELRFTIACP